MYSYDESTLKKSTTIRLEKTLIKTLST